MTDLMILKYIKFTVNRPIEVGCVTVVQQIVGDVM